jgi:uncharacterized lipoprotein
MSMRSRATLALLLGLATVASCSREPTKSCESSERYSTARSVPPVQIPDDLSPPNEEEALRLPPDSGASAAQPTEECLEAPPSFSGGARRDPGEAEPPAEPAPSDAPANPDRVIEN